MRNNYADIFGSSHQYNEHVASYLDPCRGVVALIQAIQPDIVLPDRSVALVKTKYKF
jgi:hypothetical protein